MESNSLFARSIHPFKQATTILAFYIVCNIFVWAFVSAGVLDKNPVLYWEAGFTCIMIYVIFSSALCFSYKNKMQYYTFALIAFAIMVVVTGFGAYFISGLSIDEVHHGSFRWLYIVFTFSYLVLLTIVNAMSKIINYARKQDAALRGEQK